MNDAEGSRLKAGARTLRDLGAVMAVGGGSVGVALIVGNLPIRRTEWIALVVMAGLLLLFVNSLTAILANMGWKGGIYFVFIGASLYVFFAFGALSTARGRWPIPVGAFAWWVTVGCALVFGILGLGFRRAGDRDLDQIEAKLEQNPAKEPSTPQP